MSENLALDKRYDDALDFASENLGETQTLFGCSLSELDDFSVVDLLLALDDQVQTHVPQPTKIYHTVTDAGARALYFEAQENPDAYDVATRICTDNLHNDAPLPFMLRMFIVEQLNGRYERKKRKGPLPGKDFARRWFLYEETKFISLAFEIPLTRNDASKISACDCVVTAADWFGVKLNYNTIRDWCSHDDYISFRRRADGLTNYVKDKYLIELGVLKRG